MKKRKKLNAVSVKVEQFGAIEYLQCHVAKSLDGFTQVAVAVGIILSGQDNSSKPEVGEDEVEQQNVAVICAEEECHEEEYDCQDRLCESESVSVVSPWTGRLLPLTMTSR